MRRPSAVYDVRTALGLTVAELAMRVGRTEDEVESIEEAGTEPTVACCLDFA